MSRIASSVASIVVGIVLALALVWCWAFIAANNPLPGLLIKNGLSGAGFWIVITSTDFIINLILCLPAAWVLRQLGRNIRANTALAVIAFAATGAIVVGLPLFSYELRIGVQYALLLASLPIAVWLLSRLDRRAPNNSFKPKPLRGSS